MLDPHADSNGRNQFIEAETRQQGRQAEPFPPVADMAGGANEPNPLKKAMASVDLLQALEEVDAEEQPQQTPAGLDDILLAELGPDADPEIPRAAAAIDRQLLLSRIVKARDAILAEEQQAARTISKIARPEAAPLAPAYDREMAPEPQGSGFREALTLRRIALAVSVTALCIGAGWTLRSGELPGFVPAVSISAAEAPSAEAPPARPAMKPAVSASLVPVAAAPTGQSLAERMAPAVPDGNDDAARIKERLIETHSATRQIESGATPQPIEAKAEPAPPPPGPATSPVSVPAASTPPAAEKVETQIARVEPVPPAPVPVPVPKTEPVAPASKARDIAAVEMAMAASPGLDALLPAQRTALKERLVAGECPSTALAALLGKAPVVATRDLVKNLEDGC